MRTLKDVKIGGKAKVVKLHGEGALKRRIMDMGLTKGVEVYVRKVAPLGDPIELTLRGYELSLRRVDAEMIEVSYLTHPRSLLFLLEAFLAALAYLPCYQPWAYPLYSLYSHSSFIVEENEPLKDWSSKAV